eukprot:CAMPEP_0198514958 /NCGR_PEP_ID=MMETSP1462-20131121/17022_1 /TAXON_ID=1333877 /ORGANISM="Brandtodinium nutriculum, Strain RCC3387" /LENGTH=208 /DNA_ID=CAMNT_0044244443 /DNA_START=70 /DNA_END=693 /DNA_ORIENTATION=-
MGFMDLVAFPGCSWALLLSPLYNSVNVATQVVMLFAGECITAWKLAVGALAVAAVAWCCALACLFDALGEADRRSKVALASCCAGSFFCAGLFQSAVSQLAVRLAPTYGPLVVHLSNGLAISGLIAMVLNSGLTAVFGEALAVKASFGFTAALSLLGVLVVARFARTGQFREEPSEFARNPELLSMCIEVDEGEFSVLPDAAQQAPTP